MPPHRQSEAETCSVICLHHTQHLPTRGRRRTGYIVVWLWGRRTPLPACAVLPCWQGAASAGLDMRVSLAAELWSICALVLLFVALSALSDPDSSAFPDDDFYEDILSHLGGSNPWDNSSMEPPPPDWLQPESPCPSHPLLEDIFSQYTSVPRFLLTLARHDACQNLEGNMQNVHLQDLSELRPHWLVDAVTAGECPWHLVRRELLHDTLPPAILEVSCLCDGHRCSLRGDFECISVKQQVMVWSTEATDGSRYQPRILQVTAACVCAQRHAPEANYARPEEWKK